MRQLCLLASAACGPELDGRQPAGALARRHFAQREAHQLQVELVVARLHPRHRQRHQLRPLAVARHRLGEAARQVHQLAVQAEWPPRCRRARCTAPAAHRWRATASASNVSRYQHRARLVGARRRPVVGQARRVRTCGSSGEVFGVGSHRLRLREAAMSGRRRAGAAADQQRDHAGSPPRPKAAARVGGVACAWQ